MRVKYLGTAPGQAAQCGFDVVIGRNAAGEKIRSGLREYRRGEVYLVSDELGAALLKFGGFEVVEESVPAVEAQPPKRGRAAKEE